MIRIIVLSLALVLMAGCASNPTRGGANLDVVAESNYCGTSSQDSDVHYFADASAFGDWIEYRSVTEFEPRMASPNGIIIVEMGQRPTGGYNVKLDRDASALEDNVLKIAMVWNAPRLDAAVSQALIASCVAIRPPKEEFRTVRVVDQLGNVRGETQAR